MQLERINNILRQLDIILRGKKIDEVAVLENLRNLYEIYSKLSHEVTETSEDEKSNIISSAIKLHNNARTIQSTSENISNIKAFSKGVAAWLLTKFGKSRPKDICMNIKLHVRSGQELLNFQSDLDPALSCLAEALNCWNKLNSNALERTLSAVEYEELRLIVFGAFLDRAKLLKSARPGNFDEIRQCISGAMELVQSLSNVKLTFTKHVMDIGHHFARNCKMEEAIHYYKIAINVLETSQSCSVSEHKEASQVETLQLKVRAYFSLSNAYKETNQYVKAIASIKSIEAIPVVINSELSKAIEITKLQIYCKSGELEAADSTIRAMMKQPGRMYEESLRAILTVVDACGHEFTQAQEYFKLLAFHFPNDPEFTSTRVNHLSNIITTLRSPIMESKVHSKFEETIRTAFIISEAVIEDHLIHEHELDDENIQIIRNLLKECINWHRHMGRWKYVIEWCTLLLRLFPKEGEVEERTLIMLWHTDALLHYGNYNDANNYADRCLELTKSTRTILMAFKTKLLNQEIDEAVNLIIKLQEGENSSDWNPSKNNEHNFTVTSGARDKLDNLERILLCVQVAKESTVNHSKPSIADNVVPKLYRIWLKKFINYEAWRAVSVQRPLDTFTPNQSPNTDIFPNVTFVSVLCELAQTFIDENLDVVRSPESCAGNLFETAKNSCTVQATTTSSDLGNNHERIIDNINAECPNNDNHELDSDAYSAASIGIDLTPPTASGNNGLNDTTPVERNQTPSDEMTEPVFQLSNIEPSTPNDDATCKKTVLKSGLITAQHSSDSGTDSKNSLRRKRKLHDEDNDFKPTSQIEFRQLTPISIAVGAPAINRMMSANSNTKYPETLNKCNHHYFRCSWKELYELFYCELDQAINFISTVRDEGYSVSLLGSSEDLHWLGDLCWNIGYILTNSNKMNGGKDLALLLSIKNNNRPMDDLLVPYYKGCTLLMAAKFLEMADRFYSLIEDADVMIKNKNQTFCLLISSALRLDADTLLISPSTLSAEIPKENTQTISSDDRKIIQELFSNNLDISLKHLRVVNHQLRRQIGFEYQSEKQMRKVTLVLEFAVLCRTDGSSLENFIEERQNAFLELSAYELQRCAEIAVEEKKGSALIAQKMLSYAVQVATREVEPDLSLLGELYYKLIGLSSTRKKALEIIEQFEQLLRTTTQAKQQQQNDYPNETTNCTNTTIKSTDFQEDEEANNPLDGETSIHTNSFCKEDINGICSLCYNWGITLLELEQPDLSEKFISKALAIFPYTSMELSEWKNIMQEAYAQALKSKAEMLSLVKSNYAFFPEESRFGAVPVKEMGLSTDGYK